MLFLVPKPSMYKVSCIMSQPLPRSIPAPIEHRSPGDEPPRVWVHTWIVSSEEEVRSLCRALKRCGISATSGEYAGGS